MEWAGTITDFNEEDIAKLDISRVSSYSWMVYQLLIRYVPHGNLITYGDLAALFGSRGGARAVGTAMAKTPGRYWYRVIGSLLALEWLEGTVHQAVNTPSRNYSDMRGLRLVKMASMIRRTL